MQVETLRNPDLEQISNCTKAVNRKAAE